MEYREVAAYLYALKHHGAKYGIDRMQALVEKLGHPEGTFPVIHVAGTNGKGSVCAMLEEVFRCSGYKTGMFVSPHLVRLEERFQVNRVGPSHNRVLEYVEKLKVVSEEIGKIDKDLYPSFFEFVNAIAFMYFRDEEVDVGIIEVGLGGEKDSTNVVEPEVSVITSISHDHNDILGPEIEDIARAKAGIIKAGKPVVIGLLPPQAEAIVREKAEQMGCSVHSVREVYGDELENYPRTNLKGSHQRINAGVVSLVLDALSSKFVFSNVGEALNQVFLAGRWQQIALGDGTTLILDVTHNEEGSLYLEKNLAGLKEKPIVVFGTLCKHRARALVEGISKYADKIYLVKPAYFRAVETEELEEIVRECYSGEVVCTAISSLFPLKDEAKTYVVTGSCYLVGEVMEYLGISAEAD